MHRKGQNDPYDIFTGTIVKMSLTFGYWQSPHFTAHPAGVPAHPPIAVSLNSNGIPFPTRSIASAISSNGTRKSTPLNTISAQEIADASNGVLKTYVPMKGGKKYHLPNTTLYCTLLRDNAKTSFINAFHSTGSRATVNRLFITFVSNDACI